VRERIGDAARLVAMSGYAQREASPAGSPFDAYLVKPVDPEHLAALLENV
jgi:hypothetical protein